MNDAERFRVHGPLVPMDSRRPRGRAPHRVRTRIAVAMTAPAIAAAIHFICRSFV